MLNDFEEVNAILNQLADDGIVEHMVEPCDDSNAHPLDWAEVAGISDEIFDDMYYIGKEIVDERGQTWYVT